MSKYISIDNPIFKDAKLNFDRALEKTMAKMIQIGATKTKTTLSIECELRGTDEYGRTVPTFKWKISTSIPLKGKQDGELNDQYILETTDEGLTARAVAEQTSMV